jgi:hypothetical protein
MHASRKRRGSCLLMILASLAVLTGFVMTAVGGALFVGNSQSLAVAQRTYHRQADRVRELNRQGRTGGPRRDPFTDAQIKGQMEVMVGTLQHHEAAKDGLQDGLGLLAAGIITILLGGGLFVLSVVLLVIRRAFSKPAPTRDAGPPPESDVPPQPASQPE